MIGCLESSQGSSVEGFEFLSARSNNTALKRWGGVKFALIRRDVRFEGVVGSPEGDKHTSVVEMFFWIGEDGGVRHINTVRIFIHIETGGFGLGFLFDCGEVVLDDPFCLGVKILDGDKEFGVEVAFGTASRGGTVFNGVEAQDTDILGVIEDTLTEKLRVFVHSNGREERLEEGGHSRLFVACR